MNKPRSVMPLNPYKGGITRTVKANYYKVSQSNFLYATQRGATGVIKIYENILRLKPNTQSQRRDNKKNT